MATKSGQDTASTEQVEELLDAVDSTLDRLKTLYEQYFLGIQKQAPAYIHSDVERKLRELTQLNIRNTGLRYRLATLQQKFGSYNSYWRRTLRQIENGTYLRNLAKVGREAARTGSHIPEEILAAMPKRMREQVIRDRDQAIAIAQRRQQIEAADAAGADDAFSLIHDKTEQLADVPVRRDHKTASGAHVISDDDVDIDFNELFSAFEDDAPKADSLRAPAANRTETPSAAPHTNAPHTNAPSAAPRMKEPSTPPRPQLPRMPVPVTSTGPVPLATPPPTQTSAIPRPAVPTPASGSTQAIPRAVGQQPSGPTQSEPGSGPTQGIPRPIGGQGSQPSAPIPRPPGAMPPTQTGPVPVVPRGSHTGAVPVVATNQTGPLPPVPAPRPTGPIPTIPAPPRQTGPVPTVPRPPAPSQQSRPIPVSPGAAAQTGPIAVESMSGPFPRNVADPASGPQKTGAISRTQPMPRPQQTQGIARPAAPQKPPPGMSEADVNALHAKYVKAKEMIGEKVDAGSREKLLKTINQTAPKIMAQYKASGVDFSVVVKDNQVIIKAKPKT